MPYTKPQSEGRRKRKVNGRERDQIKLIDFRLEKWQGIGFSKARRR